MVLATPGQMANGMLEGPPAAYEQQQMKSVWLLSPSSPQLLPSYPQAVYEERMVLNTICSGPS